MKQWTLSQTVPAAKTGTPVYYSSMVSNLHAGKEFYLDSLKDNYQLSFSDDFEDVMNQIEKEYKAANGLTDASDTRATGQTASSDSLLVRNWQDILAVYVYEQSQQGVSEYKLDASAKDALAEIFAELKSGYQRYGESDPCLLRQLSHQYIHQGEQYCAGRQRDPEEICGDGLQTSLRHCNRC